MTGSAKPSYFKELVAKPSEICCIFVHFLLTLTEWHQRQTGNLEVHISNQQKHLDLQNKTKQNKTKQNNMSTMFTYVTPRQVLVSFNKRSSKVVRTWKIQPIRSQGRSFVVFNCFSVFESSPALRRIFQNRLNKNLNRQERF